MNQEKKLSASLEDYLEAIYLVCRDSGEARSKDIMNLLGVTGPSVTEALQLLRDKKLVNYAPYYPISLTSEGETLAKDILFRHETLREFFIDVLGVDTKTADEGACQMEHVASPGIIDRMIRYTTYLREESNCYDPDSAGSFKEYLKTQGN